MSKPPLGRESAALKRRRRHEPWMPAPYEPADIGAIKALAAGQATAEQQQRALNFIVYVAAGTYDETFYPGGQDGERLSCFAAGKRFVGNTIVKMTKLTTPSRLSTDVE